MEKKLSFIFLILFAGAFRVNADSYNAEVICDPVSEINSLILSKDTVVQPAFHYIDGEPVQCLRFSFLPESSRTSLFARIKVNNLADKKINFICAVASAENNKTAFFELVANGSKLFDTHINNQTVYFRTEPPIDNNGDVVLSFKIIYDSSKNTFPVDIIFPALVSLRKIDKSSHKYDIQFGTTDSRKTWMLSGIKNLNLNKTDDVFLLPQIELLEVISKSIEPKAGTPVKVTAVLKNSGWKDYISTPDNAVKISVDKKSGVTDIEKQTQLIPDIPAGELAEIEWTVHTHKNIFDIKGEIVSSFLKKKRGFSIPVFSKNMFRSDPENKSELERIIEKNLIAYDWFPGNVGNVRIRFVKSPAGVKNIQFSLKEDNEYKMAAIVNQLAAFDIITPDNSVKKIMFLPKKVRYLENPDNKVLVSGWAFSKETGGLIVEQYYSWSKSKSKINIETKITSKKNIKITKVHSPVFNLEAVENDTLIIPGFTFENLSSPSQPKKYKWMQYNPLMSGIPVSQQLIPYIYAGSLNGAIRFDVFDSNDMMWLVDSNKKCVRYRISNIAKPSSGYMLKHLTPEDVLSVNLSVSIHSKNTNVSSLLPEIISLGVVPAPLVYAEKQRLMKKFIMSVECTNYFSCDEMKVQAILLRESKNKNKNWDPEISANINRLYSGLLPKISTNKFIAASSSYASFYGVLNNNKQGLIENAENELLKLCTKYDWSLDKNITGSSIIIREHIQKILDDVSRMLIAGEIADNEDAISLCTNVLSKLRNRLIYTANNYPELSTYAKLAKANVMACRITGDRSFLKEANRLLRVSEIFFKKSNDNTTRGIGMAEGKIGYPTPENNFAGLLSPEATIAFADALYDAAEIDKMEASRNLRLANLIIKSVEKFYLKENKNGLIPEFWSREFNTPKGKYIYPYFLWEIFLRQK